MAITDIQISDTLETGAPSIKYEGNEGPQDPRQEQMVAQLKEEYKKYVFEMQEQGLEPMSFQQFIEQVMAEGQMSSAQPMPNRQMAAYGGIMDVGGRRRYAFGSIKKRIRKLIPNEVAKVAEVAAPFVAPFNPALAGVMSGVGGFDRHGSISKGLKSGLMNYGMGQAARYMGGAELQGNPFSMTGGYGGGAGAFRGGMEGFRGGFSKPIGTNERFFDDWFGGGGGGGKKVDETKSILEESTNQGDYTKGGEKIIEAGNKGNAFHNFLKGMGMDTAAMAGIVGASALAGLYTAKNPADDSIEQMRGKGFDMDAIRTEVREAFRDPTGKALEEIRIKYPFLGAKETKNIDIMAQGGRAGFYEGGLSIPSENTMEDARKTAMQDRLGGITEIMKQADLYRQGDVGQMYMAGGGDTTPWWKFWADDEAAAGELTTQQKNKIKKDKRLKELKKELGMAQGGRIGYALGEGVESIPIDQMKEIEGQTAGGGDRGWRAQMLAEDLAEEQYGKEFYDLTQKQQFEIYNIALDMIDSGGMAQGGRIGAQEGGLMDLGGMEKDYRNDGGFVPIGGKEKADDVPARLSKNEFVFTADAVRGAGGGDIDKGAEIMENVMKKLENGGRISEESQGLKGAQEMFDVSERLSEVV